MAQDFVVRFWGVRGGYPVPGSHTVRYGGNTPCVEVQAGRHTIILDAGTGIINLGADLVRRAAHNPHAPLVITLLFSHMHHDHTQGFPFFKPAFHAANMLHIFGPKVLGSDISTTLTSTMLPAYFPIGFGDLGARKELCSLSDSDVVVLGTTPDDVRVERAQDHGVAADEVCISVYHSYAHPKNGVHIYRITWNNRSVVYATDTEGYVEVDQRLMAFMRDADVLIHDAQYLPKDYADPRDPKQGWGHSTVDMACAIARQSGVKQLVLFHHDPTHDDAKIACIEEAAQRLFPQARAAYEGLEVRLDGAASVAPQSEG